MGDNANGGGGGGGAGSLGLNGNATTKGGAGGTGVVSTISGATNWYAGGGGGASYGAGALGGAGGLGGGGKGADYTGTASNGVANTGGGGGGASGYAPGATNGAAGGSGIVIVRYVTVATDVPQIENRAPTGVTTGGATFNGYLAANGSGNAAVFVAWGQTNGAVSGAWATTNWWASGAWTNGSYPSTNLTLSPNANYYYVFGASNSLETVVASNAQYLITGEVTVQPTDPTGRVTQTDTAAFTVYRPASCTNEALTVAYTLSGTATNGTHYTNSPAATGTNGTLTIPAGQTNAVVTVWPLNVAAPQQTVVLSLVSSNYPIGSANAATCTLVAANVTYTWTVSNGLWTNAANWNPSGGPPAGGDTGILTGLTCIANANLAGGPTIEVRTNASLYCGNGAGTFSNHTIKLNGGRWVLNIGGKGTITSSDTVALESDSEVRAGINGDDQQWILSGSIRDGYAGGKGRLLINTTNLFTGNLGLGFVDITGTNNTYSGGTAIIGNNSAGGQAKGGVRALAPGCFGLGHVTVSDAALFLATNSTTSAGNVIAVNSGGRLHLGVGGGMGVVFNSSGHSILLRGGSSLYTELHNTMGNLVNSYDAYAVEGAARIGLNTEGAAHFYGPITNGATAGKIVVLAPYIGGNYRLYFDSPSNTFSGGLDVEAAGYVSIATNNAYGTGPITLLATNSYLTLDQTPNADWTVTNSLAGKGTITVEAGANRLTCGGIVNPGMIDTNVTTNTTGILRIAGKMGLAAGSRLAIGIAGTNSVAGVDYSQLSVSAGDATLAASITNCDLSVTVAPKLGTDGLVVTNLLATGANFSSYKFRSVAWNPGWAGNVQYTNGCIVLTNIRSTAGGTVLMVY